MKVCANCGDEIATPDGENRCRACERATRSPKKRAMLKRNKAAHEEALRSLGLVKVKGAMGGTYWE